MSKICNDSETLNNLISTTGTAIQTFETLSSQINALIDEDIKNSWSDSKAEEYFEVVNIIISTINTAKTSLENSKNSLNLLKNCMLDYDNITFNKNEN